MLISTYTGLGAEPSEELVDLKEEVDRCLRIRAAAGFTSTDAGASDSITCSSKVSDGLQAIEKLSLIDAVNNQLVFDITRNIIRQWRGMGVPTGTPDSREAEIRRLAAQKLGEPAVGGLSPDAAIIQLSAASRDETDGTVQLAIIRALTQLITKDTAPNIRTEALTSLKILADPSQPNLGVRAEAQIAVKKLEPEITLGPVTVTSLGKPRPKFLVPLLVVAMVAGTASVIWYVVQSRRRYRTVSGVGPLRRRVEGQLRRRRVITTRRS